MIEDKTGERLLSSDDGSVICFSDFPSADDYRLNLTLSNLDHPDNTWICDVVEVKNSKDKLIVRNAVGRLIHTFHSNYVPFSPFIIEDSIHA
ncbi:hypothetical protein [Vibrio coralliilyticus]|uniref:Uncharacterized protein n=1 Tax=Vibrio coralliilyticus TaxID=190893 RepID=A0AAP6ZUF5_9VIBR|nr:hypothetical protein [Vibrio coralliilyticus]NOI31819.1 hypothetical protein [Vibrio coralliilyticus]NOJ25262.1 hypothetical protein [Vibrio coralliilyticus]